MIALVKKCAMAFGGIILLWSIGFGAFSLVALTEKPRAYDHHPHPHNQADAIITLTGGNYRIATGMELLAQSKAPQLYITGIFPHVTMDHVMESWPDAFPQPGCCITLGREARTTIENALEAQKWIKQNDVTSIYLVTSTYHMQRALQEFKSLMPTLTIIPYPVTRDDYRAKDKKFWDLAFSEYHKYWYRKAQILLGL